MRTSILLPFPAFLAGREPPSDESPISMSCATNRKGGLSRAPRLSALLDKSKAITLSQSHVHISSQSASDSSRLIISSPQALVSRPPYRPLSASDFLNRLGSFKLATYRDKPAATDAVVAARHGWKNDGIDRLVCESCSATWVVGSIAGMSLEAGNFGRS